MKPTVFSRLLVSNFRQVGCTDGPSLCKFMQCHALMIQQKQSASFLAWPCFLTVPQHARSHGAPPWVRAREGCGGSGNLHPTASLGQGLVTPGLGLKWGSQLAGIGGPDRCIGALRAPAFRRGSKVSTYLPCTTTLLPLKGRLPWSNSLSTSFSSLRGFSMCLHLCPQKLFSAQCRCFRFM